MEPSAAAVGINGSHSTASYMHMRRLDQIKHLKHCPTGIAAVSFWPALQSQRHSSTVHPRRATAHSAKLHSWGRHKAVLLR